MRASCSVSAGTTALCRSDRSSDMTGVRRNKLCVSRTACGWPVLTSRSSGSSAIETDPAWTFAAAHLGGLAPEAGKIGGLHQFDLLGKPVMIQCHQRIVAVIRRAAQGILDDHHTVAEIDCIEHRGQHA